MADKQKAQYAPPTSQVDLAARLENENQSDRILSTSDEAARREADLSSEPAPAGTLVVEGNKLDGYVATDPIYQNYANETEAPLVAKEGEDKNPENQLFEQGFGQLPRHSWEIDEETVKKVQGTEDEAEDEDPTVTDPALTEPALTKPPTPSGDNS